jgi:hypothetical protein
MRGLQASGSPATSASATDLQLLNSGALSQGGFFPKEEAALHDA